jgi:hypothetical protein
MAQALPFVSAGLSIYNGIRGARKPGQSGAEAQQMADPFSQHRGQFGQQLSTLFADGKIPDWMNPGMGLDMGQNLPDAGSGMADVSMLDPSMLRYDPEAIKTDPAYQAQLAAGREAIQNSAAASGMLDSGATLADLTRFGQGLASDFTGKQFDRNMQRFGANLSAFGAQNQAQNQGFGQSLASLAARNQAQGQRFGQGNQYANFLAQLAGANQNPAAGAQAFQNGQQSLNANRRQGFQDILSGFRGFSGLYGNKPNPVVGNGGAYNPDN